mmetsp:Transcript_61251/g.126525  ORF Transcript_61251/g.126525 Transcript_61251/m.126525 type:complete len:113 (+) Transcript_61251:1590-1928(+)
MVLFFCRLCGKHFFKIGNLNKHILVHFENCKYISGNKIQVSFVHLTFLTGQNNPSIRFKKIFRKITHTFNEIFFLFFLQIKKNFVQNIQQVQNKILSRFFKKNHTCLKILKL